MNIGIEGDQRKILWHIVDIKTSHKDPKVVTIAIDLIGTVYGR